MRVFAIIIGLLGFVIGGCASSQSQGPSDSSYEAVAHERFGGLGRVQFVHNRPDSSYVLAVHQAAKTPEQPIPPASYFVYDLRTDSVTVEESDVQGTVRWADSLHLRVELVPGTVPQDPQEAERAYLVDVRTGRRTADSAQEPRR